MIKIPESDFIHRTLCIDNGTNTLGAVILDTDLRERLSTVIYANTIQADRTAYHRFEGIMQRHGQLEARLEVLGEYTWEVLQEFDPHLVAVEAPFINPRRPGAVTPLTRAMERLRRTVRRFDEGMEFLEVPPFSAKRAVLKKGKWNSDKNSIRDAVLALDDIQCAQGIDLRQLDEHCIDAVAVGEFVALDLFERFARF